MSGTLGKGKGKEVAHGNAVTMGNTPADMDLGDGGDGDDDDATGKGEKKKKNTYKHLIKGIPGVLLVLSLKSFHGFQFFSIFDRKTLLEKGRFSNESDARTPKAKDENSPFRF
jgi:hypothetical protein